LLYKLINVFYSNFLSNHNSEKLNKKGFLMSSIPISYQTTTGELFCIAAIKMSSIPISYQTTTSHS